MFNLGFYNQNGRLVRLTLNKYKHILLVPIEFYQK